MHQAARRCRGLTLIEIAVALAVVALLATLALPSFSTATAKHRLVFAAETLASDLAEARFEAAQSGAPLHLVFRTGTDWCYAVARTAECGCRQPAPCQLKTVQAATLPGIALGDVVDAGFDPTSVANIGGRATFHDRRSDLRLRVVMTPLGRARLCSPDGMQGYPRC